MTGQKTGGKFRIFVTAFFVLGGSCLPGEAGEMGSTGENNLYRGSSGALYNYDLSNPSDQLRYSVDPGAQLRNSINVDPRVEIDRSLGSMVAAWSVRPYKAVFIKLVCAARPHHRRLFERWLCLIHFEAWRNGSRCTKTVSID